MIGNFTNPSELKTVLHSAATQNRHTGFEKVLNLLLLSWTEVYLIGLSVLFLATSDTLSQQYTIELREAYLAVLICGFAGVITNARKHKNFIDSIFAYFTFGLLGLILIAVMPNIFSRSEIAI